MSARRDELTEPAMDAAIERACVILRLPTVRDRYGEVAGIALRQQASYKGFLTELLSLECDDRETRRRARLLREAGFPRPKRLEDFDFAANPEVPASRSSRALRRVSRSSHSSDSWCRRWPAASGSRPGSRCA
jgi:DNA replication protein DnaC